MNGEKQYPLSKDEEKGLLYGSLIAAGMAALSGRNIAEGIQNAAAGFGTAYSGGLAQLLKMKEDELKALREQEELNLRKLQTESTIGYQDVLKEQVTQNIAEAKQREAARRLLADYFRKAGGERGEMLAGAAESGMLDEVARAAQPWNIPIEGEGGQPVITNLFGQFWKIYQPPANQIDIKTAIDIEEKRANILSKSFDEALNYAKLNLGDNNTALQLISGTLPAGQRVDPDDWQKFKKEFYEQLTRVISLKRMAAPNLVTNEVIKALKTEANVWIKDWENTMALLNTNPQPGPGNESKKGKKNIFKEIAEKIFNEKKNEAENSPGFVGPPVPPKEKRSKGFDWYLRYLIPEGNPTRVRIENKYK